jgi:tetratricopeptide (TPR) repeat protein/transcriptional regulator with XRE-family HTH domain
MFIKPQKHFRLVPICDKIGIQKGYRMKQGEASSIISFGYWVQQRRKVLDLTRLELAQRVGCAPITIKKIERDERRPSRQIANLLADHLVIPDPDRDKFIRMARGEFVASTISSLGLVSLPAFLRTPDALVKREDSPLVAREGELARLETHLSTALTGKGGIVFVTGEAGSGKTFLAQEFARQAQEKYPHLVVANGNCNAHTGVGDPYLPFREVLELLTGEIETRWVAGLMSQTYAQRLWDMVPHAVQALTDVGSELVDRFVSGSALVARAEAASPGTSGPLAQLKSLVARHRASQSPAHLQQSDLFAQYTRVLQTLARQKPLLLIVDDLQWADVGSIGLLFHLARRLEGHRILVVGLYRPSDIRLGRFSTNSGEPERHPLEPVINELQGQFGNIQIVLDQAEGKQFVEAFLDTEPNRLGAGFREALFRQTGGHALFTVEMLRGLQARGDLVQDEQGQWTEGVILDWQTLPARVEGVIKERINRLPMKLQEVLKVASVEGEVFTADVVARVQGLDERQMINQLGSVLDRQQRLIRMQGTQQLGTKQVSHYRFRHILFQQFLYESLAEAERVYLHRAIGNELERLHGEQADSIAPQLARHFALAGDHQRALGYATRAGDMAAAAHAYVEAVSHYSQALEITRRHEASSQKLAHLYTELGRVLELNSQYNQALITYEKMETVAHQRSDRHLQLAARMAQVTLFSTFTSVHDPARAESLGEQTLALARELDDQVAEAKILWVLVFIYLNTNRVWQAIDCGERSLALARQLDLREQMAYCLNDLGSHCYLVDGPLDRAITVLNEACLLWRELDNLPMLANSMAASSLVQTYAGEYSQALALSEEAFQISQSIDNLWGQSYSRIFVGYVYWERGEPDRAVAVMEECIHLSELSGFIVPQTRTRAELAYVYGKLGAIERGLETVHPALIVAESQVPPFRVCVLAVLAQLHLWQDNLIEAKAVIDQGKQDPSREGWPLHYLPLRLADGELALRQGDFERVIGVTDRLLVDLRRMGVRIYVPNALYLQGQALLGLNQREMGRKCVQEARIEAEAIGSRPSLWPILFSLSQLEDNPAEAQALRQQSQEIVEYIAGNVENAELRASFLALPDVATILEPIPNE